MPIGNENNRDPRVRLVRQKYFTIRPRPLEAWLWTQRIPASAERVFWLHWREGALRGDWCSEIPLRRVARECHLDTSTVTRAYQLLTKLGCLRRTDPGRDPANPFHQATAITEVRLPRELLAALDQSPNRKNHLSQPDPRQPGRAGEVTLSAPADALPQTESPDTATAPSAKAMTLSISPTHGSSVDSLGSATPTDPFAGLSGRDRIRALSRLTDLMSLAERHAYQEAMRLHRPQIAFDLDSKLPEEGRATILQVLAWLASHQANQPTSPRNTNTRAQSSTAIRNPPRTLSVFELARLKRDIQAATTPAATPELLRQVIWSIQSGALKRFDLRHAIHIALKKIRQGAWTRPNRMPPRWTHSLCQPSAHETCRRA